MWQRKQLLQAAGGALCGNPRGEPGRTPPTADWPRRLPFYVHNAGYAAAAAGLLFLLCDSSSGGSSGGGSTTVIVIVVALAVVAVVAILGFIYYLKTKEARPS